MKPCRITFLAFFFGDIQKGLENGYTNDDLKNSIKYCEHLIEDGFINEPMDGFNLYDFINWAKVKIIEP